MLYIFAVLMVILSANLEGTSSDVAIIGAFIFLGLGLQTSVLKRKD